MKKNKMVLFDVVIIGLLFCLLFIRFIKYSFGSFAIAYLNVFSMDLIKTSLTFIIPKFLFILLWYIGFRYILTKLEIIFIIKKIKKEINITSILLKIKWYVIILLILFGTFFIIKSFNVENKGKVNLKANGNLSYFENIVIFPEPTSLIEVKMDTLGQELPSSKSEGDLPVVLSMTIDGVNLTTYGEIKVQGSSTAYWPKKNWSLKFYSDQNRSERLKIKIGNSIASEDWIAKAEWIDPTMLRNALSYRLWGSIVDSRKTIPKYEVDNAWASDAGFKEGLKTEAQGFPKTHPVHIIINNEHYGLSMLILGHDPANFNIDKDNLNHVYMEFDARGGYTDIKTWEKFSANGVGKWIDGYYPKNEDFTDEQLNSIEELGKFINGSLENFKTHFSEHLDKTNMIDMLLFLEIVYDWDAVAQDIEMVTYDLNKWYLLPWDKDTTFGMDWDCTGIREGLENKLLINYQNEDETQKPWYKTYHSFKEEVELRYAYLRNNDVFTVNNLYNIIESIINMIPNDIWEIERSKWEEFNRPSYDDTSTYQIISWFKTRLKTLDNHFNYYQ